MKAIAILTGVVAIVLMAWAADNPTTSKAETQGEGISVYSPEGVLIAKSHAVVGTTTVAGRQGTTIGFAGESAFTNAESYQCFVSTTYPGPILSSVIKIDGNHIKMPGSTNPSPWVVNYMCIGN